MIYLQMMQFEKLKNLRRNPPNIRYIIFIFGLSNFPIKLANIFPSISALSLLEIRTGKKSSFALVTIRKILTIALNNSAGW